ncbi:NAD(P)-binding protein [Streptomyces sp. NPDC093085]|uniref:NAD(P)-binding protein n=1 Tax=Streptomyces sp. NPDC093085 TaxID=3155068 RepID=UPI003422E174
MDYRADVVVAGAGHNSLITAACLAEAGYRCLVLDARDIPGGAVAPERPLGPDYMIDSCATGHTLIRPNPVLMFDERGLVADHGQIYVDPDPVAHRESAHDLAVVSTAATAATRSVATSVPYPDGPAIGYPRPACTARAAPRV